MSFINRNISHFEAAWSWYLRQQLYPLLFNSVLRIRIAGSGAPPKNQDPDPGWTTRIIFPRAYKLIFFFWLNLVHKFRIPESGMEKVRSSGIWDKHPGYPQHLFIWHLMTQSPLQLLEYRNMVGILLKVLQYHSSNISHFETVYSCLKGYPDRNKRKTAEVLLFFVLESSTRVHKKMS